MSEGVRTEMWVHPCSLSHDGPRQAEQLARCGIRSVRLAASYHAGRWLLTTSRPGAVEDLADSVPMFPVRPDRFGALHPVPSASDQREAFGTAARALRGAGLGVSGWLVTLHNSPLATAFPQSALRNVFGRPYRHALCPAHPEVAEYVVALVGELATQDVDAVDLEGLGYLGWPHAGHHDKVGVALRPVDVALLSLCFCPACHLMLAEHGADVERVVDRVERAIRGQLADPQPGAGPDVAEQLDTILGATGHAAIRAARAAVVGSLVARVAAASTVPVDLRVTGREHDYAGKSGGDLAALAVAADRVTVTSLRTDLDDVDGELRALDEAAVPRARTTVGLNLMHPHLAAESGLHHAVDRLRDAGVEQVCWYGYDLAPPTRLQWLENAASLPVRGAT